MLPLQSQAARSRYVHLADGGLADNSGVNAALEIIGARGGLAGSAIAAGFSGVRKRVFIVVNAQVNPNQVDDESADTPGLLRQLRSVVDVPIDRHAQTSLRALEIATQQWSRELQSIPEHVLHGAVLRDTQFHVVEISLNKAPAGPEKDRLAQIPTALRASPDDVAALRRFVWQTARTDPQWQRLLRELQAPAPVSASKIAIHDE
jgi:NTE family protein